MSIEAQLEEVRSQIDDLSIFEDDLSRIKLSLESIEEQMEKLDGVEGHHFCSIMEMLERMQLSGDFTPPSGWDGVLFERARDAHREIEKAGVR